MSAPPALVCRGLVKRYGDVVAVNGLDLDVRRGECFGLLGPNGAGKTTTVEILEGLCSPDGGEVEVLGERWVGDGLALRARLGIQLQETRFPEKLQVAEVIALFRSFYPRGLEPEEALRRVSLQEKARAHVRTLSGGQKQRLSLACAIVGDPEVLFLDEPSTGLDPASRREIWEIVEDLKARGRTILLTTHYMEEAARLCDRVAIVDRGRVLSLGTPAALVASLGAEHVVEVEVDGELAEEELRALPAVEGVRVAGRTVRLTVRDVARALPPLLALCAERGAAPRRLATHHASLEDVFMALAGRRLEGAGEEAA
ncbi:multidrug ABC transporter ATPase [Sorangium cellulosum]|uniref:Multidrug ABC transporter ATPase n=1 Tax=Sorangium cellulosum TaxID=56 RepID=A0A2L0F1D8_SORCE|nr:ABC transporter ATP-binding protein [Sorangium cellulosum]AUX45360.1 multidrug ABC transporter ATPase [Sorangium cellulosum]